MAELAAMPDMELDRAELAKFGSSWRAAGDRFDEEGHTGHASPNALGHLVDSTVATSLATMLGGIEIVEASRKKRTQLYPPDPDCVETAPVTIVGGIRKQNYDVAYRPDGVRFAFDSKTLNDAKSVGKNWQNMVNDLATEAATVHTRFPLAVVAFLVLIPEPAIGGAYEPLTWRLDGLGGRADEHAPAHVAEAMCLALWDPDTGEVSRTKPDPSEHPEIRIENFSEQIEDAYRQRYAGSPPH